CVQWKRSVNRHLPILITAQMACHVDDFLDDGSDIITVAILGFSVRKFEKFLGNAFAPLSLALNQPDVFANISPITFAQLLEGLISQPHLQTVGSGHKHGERIIDFLSDACGKKSSPDQSL